MASQVRGVQVGSGLMPGTSGVLFLALNGAAFDWVRDSLDQHDAELSPPYTLGIGSLGFVGMVAHFP